jgi:hypothetical protein
MPLVLAWGGIGKKCPEASCKKESLRVLGTLFGGATAFPQGKGIWRDDAQGGKRLFDAPVVIQCDTGEQALERQAAKLREFLRRMGREAK